jgi:cytochrome b561
VSEPGRPASAGLVTLEKVLSVVIFAMCLFQIYQSTKVGVTPRGTPERAALQQLHLSVGLSVLPLIVARLWLWRRLPRPARPVRVPAAADALARHCNLAFYVTVLAFCLSGPFFAWSEGLSVSWFGAFTLPALVGASYRVQVTLGYLHSVFGFWILYLAVFSSGLSLWQALRYRAPLLRMLPGTGWGA